MALPLQGRLDNPLVAGLPASLRLSWVPPTLLGPPTCTGSPLRLTQRPPLPSGPCPSSPRWGWQDLLEARDLLGPLLGLRCGPGPELDGVRLQTLSSGSSGVSRAGGDFGGLRAWGERVDTGPGRGLLSGTFHGRGCRALGRVGWSRAEKQRPWGRGGGGQGPPAQRTCVHAESSRRSA